MQLRCLKVIYNILSLPLVIMGLTTLTVTLFAKLEWVEWKEMPEQGMTAIKLESFFSQLEKTTGWRGEVLYSDERSNSWSKKWPASAGSKKKFAINSLSKQFLATKLVELSEKGLISLDQPACDFISELCKGEFSQITVDHLLSHRSGLRDLPSNLIGVFAFFATKLTPLPADFAIKNRLSGSLKFNPGTDFSYSNFGYIVASLILKKITGRNIRDFFDETHTTDGVLNNTQLTLADWTFGKNGIITVPLTRLHIPILMPSSFLANSLGAGGILSTTEDLSHWMRHILNSDWIAELTRVRRNRYAIGWVQLEQESSIFWHNGASMGHHSMIIFDREKKNYLIVLSDHHATEDINKSMKELRRFFAGKTFEMPGKKRRIPKFIL